MDVGEHLRNGGTRTAVRVLGGRDLSFADVLGYVEGLQAEVEVAGARVGVLFHDRVQAGIVSLAVMERGTCIPLNVRWTDGELEKSMKSLEVDLLLVDPTMSKTRAALLRGLGVAVSEVRFRARAVEVTSIHHRSGGGSGSGAALVLLTSGSTGEPKQVALSRENLAHCVKALGASLELGEEDRVLNLLPMMHIGGLVDLFMVPLFYGGSVVFAEAGLLGGRRDFLREEELTWLQGPPAMLQYFLKTFRVDEGGSSLRFIRSVSAPLSEALAREVEDYFKVPVIEIYGMSETAGVITSNPLPPGKRKIGSVGQPVMSEVEIRNADDGVGQVWVRSGGVFSGYDAAGRSGEDWDGDWFSTGDLGRMDEEGYLSLTGRVKEVINRGGQKISPLEIDHLVQSWREVREAAAFSVTHKTLGEEVALAVVLKPEETLEEAEIHTRLREALADYKRPKKIYLTTALPRNENGKLQRHLMEDHFRGVEEETDDGVLSALEKEVSRIWCPLLEIDSARRDEDFFDLGG